MRRTSSAPTTSSTPQSQKTSDALLAWDGGADIILATAPSSEAATEAVPGLAPDGTLVILGIGAKNISIAPFDLIGPRRRVMGSPSGGRSDLRVTLNFSQHNKVLPHTTKYALEDAGKALDLMRAGKIRDRAVLMIA